MNYRAIAMFFAVAGYCVMLHSSLQILNPETSFIFSDNVLATIEAAQAEKAASDTLVAQLNAIETAAGQ